MNFDFKLVQTIGGILSIIKELSYMIFFITLSLCVCLLLSAL